ncbi:putative leucine-rich repeat receptor-like serine/threonine-protein kinase [Nymphaea thermarum]|nr:putative leucine-rich repeat receptor-like serine/threonine-protein kinase [Nymphaea thermarum]
MLEEEEDKGHEGDVPWETVHEGSSEISWHTLARDVAPQLTRWKGGHLCFFVVFRNRIEEAGHEMNPDPISGSCNNPPTRNYKCHLANFSGSLPIELRSMPQLRRFFILDNMLTNVPGSHEISILTYFTKCRMPEEVYLSQNLLNGICIASVANMTTTLWGVDLSFNQIEGIIPLALGNLTKLMCLDLSYNKIKWSILPNIRSRNILPLVHMGNHYLDNSALTRPILNSINNLYRDNPFTSHLPLDVGNLPVVDKIDISVNKLSRELTMFLSDLQRLKYLNLSKNSFDSHILDKLNGMNYLEQQITSATRVRNFGSVYKRILTDETIVVVKVQNLLFEEASQSFDVECNMICQVRHQNLVKVITSFSNIDFKALVLQIHAH